MGIFWKVKFFLGFSLVMVPCFLFSWGLPQTCLADDTRISYSHHDLKIILMPGSNRLVGHDRVSVETGIDGFVDFFLCHEASIKSVRIDGQPALFDFQPPHLKVGLGDREKFSGKIEIEYEAVFNDSVPTMPVNTDNPGYGVTGIVSERGTFLLGGAGWYPRWPGRKSTFDITVEAPRGVFAVTSGKSLVRATENGRSISRWQIGIPTESLSLSAAKYIVNEKIVNEVTIATYFLPENESLSQEYLEAAARYLRFFESLFGKYPFEKFAVVENFFPTGYGFASYTLIGGRVLRLPFIIDTSLGHEIAHCWWANGVYVDMSEGNWAEGLTTYVSDYLFKEKDSQAQAIEYRLQALRNYSTLVPPSKDFPLSEFSGRVDPVTKAVGYDKAAMVFHMLRKALGEESFWKALKKIYADRLFQKTSWTDFKIVFEQLSGKSLDRFFSQWVFRAGAPSLKLEQVRVEPPGAGKKKIDGPLLTGFISQQKPFYSLLVPLELTTDRGVVETKIALDRKRSRFSLEIPNGEKPLRLTADPGFDLFRRLDESEIPPSINGLKNSDAMLLAIAGEGKNEKTDLARYLMRALGVEKYEIVPADELAEKSISGRDVIQIGYGSDNPAVLHMPSGLAVSPAGFIFEKTGYSRKTASFFGVFPHPESKSHVAGLFVPALSEDSFVVARKVPHYGKYGYLIFEGERNVKKGTWPITRSPLIWNFQRD